MTSSVQLSLVWVIAFTNVQGHWSRKINEFWSERCNFKREIFPAIWRLHCFLEVSFFTFILSCYIKKCKESGGQSKRVHHAIIMNTTLLIVAVLLIMIGVAGAVLPALPGVPLIFVGMLLAAWINGFKLISVFTVVVMGILTFLAIIVDYVAATLSAERAGASKQGMIGAVVGTIAGLFTGLWGLVFMPLVGAAIGELIAHKDMFRAGRAKLDSDISGKAAL